MLVPRQINLWGDSMNNNNPNITREQRKMMLHALGVDGISKPLFRNHYAIEPDDKDAVYLVELGFMKQISCIPGGLVCFRVTEKGTDFLKVDILTAERDYWRKKYLDLENYIEKDMDP